MKQFLLVLILATVGCAPGSIAPAKPRTVTPRVARALDATLCDPPCVDGQACSVDGQCGQQCGLSCTGGETNVCTPSDNVCVGTSLCALGNDCIEPCRVGGVPLTYPVSGDCKAYGLWPTSDGACVVPCWYPLCSVAGGVICT